MAWSKEEWERKEAERQKKRKEDIISQFSLDPDTTFYGPFAFGYGASEGDYYSEIPQLEGIDGFWKLYDFLLKRWDEEDIDYDEWFVLSREDQQKLGVDYGREVLFAWDEVLGCEVDWGQTYYMIYLKER